MPDKTITIVLKAYELLARERQSGESFRRSMRQHLRPEKTSRRLLAHLAEVSLREETLRRAEELVAERQASPVRSPAWPWKATDRTSRHP